MKLPHEKRSLRILSAIAIPFVAVGIGWAQPVAERLSIWPDVAPVSGGTSEKVDVPITVYRPPVEKANGTAIVICPGGGYSKLVTKGEGHEIAKWLNTHGITGIVLEYRLPEGRPLVPLLDAQRALRTVRTHAKEWGIRPDRVGIIGFSAGGHLASTAVTHFNAGNPKAEDPVERVSSRPDFGILVYPVVTMGELTHGGSRKNLLGSDPKAELVRFFSNETQVTAETPPVFLAHALDDKLVPPANSRQFHEALLAQKIPTKYLELPSGGHGLNGYKGPMWDAWQTQCLEWLGEQALSTP